MDTSTARQITDKAAELIELTSAFQSRYGKHYRMKPGTPDDIWQFERMIFNQQSALARLLDPDALRNPLHRFPNWWKLHDVLDDGMATQIALEALHLIACCASYAANAPDKPSPAILCSQRVIAGLLHPSCLLIAQSDLEAAEKAS
jgi:hypothetical protein